jgi:alcohol dehydrogenase class IV
VNLTHQVSGMKAIVLQHPPKIVFGNHAIDQFVTDYTASGLKKLFLVAAPEILPQITNTLRRLEQLQIDVKVNSSVHKEPTVEMFTSILKDAGAMKADSVVGIGGGSVLDTAKLVAALFYSKQTIHEIFGIGNLLGRTVYLACIPTTAGTGSEVSPNALLLDTGDRLKKGAISPYLVPDAAYIDPMLTLTVPPAVTAATGMDALIHCIEGYANKFSHPAVDTYALRGIELIGQYIKRAFQHGNDTDARAHMALGSMYGGFCLGPVNTAAVHALAYPLGSLYQIPHGVTNAVLLPHVLRFNVESAPQRYAGIAYALGIHDTGSDMDIALKGIEKIEKLMRECQLPLRLSELDIPEQAIDSLVESAMKVSRLLRNNLREVTPEDARQIFQKAM